MVLKGYCSCSKLFNTHAIPFIGYTKNTLDSITYFWKHGKVLCNPTKTYKETNTLIKYYVIKHHGSTLLEGYCSCPKLLNRLALPLIRYPKNTLIGLHNISFETSKGNA
jgi:predicted nucleic acid-binding Zn finger protein